MLKPLLTAMLASMPFLAMGAAKQGGWTLLDIGSLGGAGSYAAAVSDNGYVTGCADTAAGETHAFLFRDGAMRDLGPGCGLAVNEAGDVAGRGANGELVLWRGAEATAIGIAQGDIGGIANDGTIVGTRRQGATGEAFIYASGTLTAIGGAGSSATAINAQRQVVGTSNGRAFLYENGALRDLGTLGGAGSSARGLNDRGVVVGTAGNEFGQPTPFIYDGAMQALPGPGYSAAIAINNRGAVVGSAEGTHGYVIEAGKYTRLDTLPAVAAKSWRRLEPTGINERGWIVGNATTPSGDVRGFVLIPRESAPTAAALLLTGAGRSASY